MKLIDQIKNVWVRYVLTGENPTAAFLYVVATYKVALSEKVKILYNIVRVHPEVLTDLTDEKIHNAFSKLVASCQSRKEWFLFDELVWVRRYVKHPDFRSQIEEDIFQLSLMATDRHDDIRRAFKWTISETAKKNVVEGLLRVSDLCSKRKVQLAHEFGLPLGDYAYDYFETLLWGRHYATAEALDLKDTDDTAIRAIIEKLDVGQPDDALNIAERFLAHRPEIAAEVKEIIEKLKH